MATGTALLVDADQVPPEGLPALIKRLSRKQRVSKRIAVRNWRSTRDQQHWREFATEHGFQLIQRDPVATGKNAADIEVAVIGMDLMHEGFQSFALVSGDTDFTPLVTRWRGGGCDVEWVHPKDIQAPKGARTRAKAPARAAKAAKPVKATPSAKVAKAVKAPAKRRTKKAATTSRAAPASANEGPSEEQRRFAKPVRRAIDQMKKEGQHERGWVSVNRLGSILAQGGHRREDFGFAKTRPLRNVLDDLGFKVQQIETGAYRVSIPASASK